MSEDGLAWTVSLVEDVQMPDGRPFRAGVVKDTLDSNRHSLAGYSASEVIDDFTLRITTTTVDAAFLEPLSRIDFAVKK